MEPVSIPPPSNLFKSSDPVSNFISCYLCSFNSNAVMKDLEFIILSAASKILSNLAYLFKIILI
jgi:hypothetical protein